MVFNDGAEKQTREEVHVNPMGAYILSLIVS